MATTPTPNHILKINALINIPLKSFPAARNASTELVNLHGPCIAPGTDPRLKMLKRCAVCLKEVPDSEIVKGHANGGGYTQFTPEEITALAADKSKAMDVLGFFPFADADPVYMGAANFIGPSDTTTIRAFLLFRKVMREQKLAALVSYYGHGRDKVGIIRSAEETLMLHDAFFQTEIRTYADQAKVQLVDTTFSPEEMTLATQLIMGARIEFASVIGTVRDKYLDRVTELRLAREAGAPIPEFSKPAPTGQVVDLLAALKASLGGAAAPEPTPSKPPVKMEAEEKPKKGKRKSA